MDINRQAATSRGTSLIVVERASAVVTELTYCAPWRRYLLRLGCVDLIGDGGIGRLEDGILSQICDLDMAFVANLCGAILGGTGPIR